MLWVLVMLGTVALVKILCGNGRTRVITLDIETPPARRYEPFPFELDAAPKPVVVFAPSVEMTGEDDDVYAVCYTREDAARDRERGR